MKDISTFRDDFSRRDFIKLSGMFMAALALPINALDIKDKWGYYFTNSKTWKDRY